MIYVFIGEIIVHDMEIQYGIEIKSDAFWKNLFNKEFPQKQITSHESQFCC